jgi:F0F1-type ATP synthase assembly protein I
VAEQPHRKPTPEPTQPGVEAYLGYGLTLAASTLLFLWLGTKADDWLGTEPWLALVGAFVGAGAGFYHMIYHLVVVPQQRKEDGEE